MEKTDNLNKFNQLREKYNKFIYKNYSVVEENDKFCINYYYSIDNEFEFCNKVEIYKKSFNFKLDLKDDLINNTIFNIGIVEGISYYKLACPKIYSIECGFLSNLQIQWWKKLIYNGLGELRYLNGVENVSFDDFVNFEILSENTTNNKYVQRELSGNLIPVGGGKDSIVTLELLKQFNNTPYLFYHTRKASYDTCDVAGYDLNNVFEIGRKLDPQLFDLNGKDFLNGHVPMSAMIAFTSYLTAILLNKKYIVLSNEASSNEGNIEGTNINHQYSKSFEFEEDFRKYVTDNLYIGIEYFSLLRPISEYQITSQLVKYPKYLDIFRSCNKGIKENIWCCNCPKCLFVYILLVPFLGIDNCNKIFGKNLLDSDVLELDFKKLIGIEFEKPFECVGTKEEIIFALKEYIRINENKELPYLVKKYISYILEYNLDINYYKYFNYEHCIPAEYLEILKEELELK